MRRENRVAFILAAKVTNLQVRIFIHTILEHLTKPIPGILPAQHHGTVSFLRRAKLSK